MKTSFVKTVAKNTKMINKLCPAYIPIALIRVILNTAAPFIQIYLSARIIDQLVAKKSFWEVFESVLWMAGTTFFIQFVSQGLSYGQNIKRGLIFDRKNDELTQKAVLMDYDILERKSTKDRMSKAEESSDAMGGLPEYLRKILALFGDVAAFIASIASLMGLFNFTAVAGKGKMYYFMTSPLSTILMLVFITISVVINSKCEKRIGELNYEASVQNNEFLRIYWYFFNSIFNLPMGKDIRMFHMQPLIVEKQRDSQEKMEAIKKKTLHKTVRIESFSTASYQCFLLFAYFFIGMKTVLGIISLGELMKYIGMIMLLQGRVAAIFSNLTQIRNHNTYIKDYTDFMEIPNEKYEGTLPVEKRLDNDYDLEFRNVSFHYPNSEQVILKNVSFHLDIGKKLAIVGRNGAGKTTFIKLLSRLYDPTEGEILLNGINIKKYSYEEYQALFSVVFQDYQIFAFSIGQNVASGTTYDETKVWECLREAGIGDRIKKFSQGLETKLMKDQQDGSEEGINISGGEGQKIALARALYRDAPIVILDEPTSALDPIAEQDIYERFNEMVKDKTALFISHRMSSCRFCDQVVVFDDGQIVQNGTHEELLKQKDGLYLEMWNAQAQYYV